MYFANMGRFVARVLQMTRVRFEFIPFWVNMAIVLIDSMDVRISSCQEVALDGEHID
jgi:hypothetical protein